MKNLIDASLCGTLINISDYLSTLRDQQTSEDNSQSIENVRKAINHVIKSSHESFQTGNPLIHDNTADTLTTVQNVISALRTGFDSYESRSLSDQYYRESFIGTAHILRCIYDALEFEIRRCDD